MWNLIKYAQNSVWTNMTNAYPFLPITPTSVPIVLFDNNGLDLNLLDPFNFEFHAGLHNSALSCKFGARCSRACMGSRQSNDQRLPGDGSVILHWTPGTRLWERLSHSLLSFSYILKPNSEELLLLTSKDMNNHKINGRADGQESHGELPLDVAGVSDHPLSGVWWGG